MDEYVIQIKAKLELLRSCIGNMDEPSLLGSSREAEEAYRHVDEIEQLVEQNYERLLSHTV